MSKNTNKRKGSTKHKHKHKHIPVNKSKKQLASRPNQLDIELLRNEMEFERYLDKLKPFADNYTVIIASIDTPIGSNFTQDMATKLCELGLMPFTVQMYRKSYIAVLHKGKVLYEKVGRDDMEHLSYDNDIDGAYLSIKSMGFSNGELARTDKSTLGIFIDNEKQTPEARGLCLIVYDSETKSIVDICNFDSFAQTRCLHYSSVTIDAMKQEFLEWVRCNPGITVLSCNTPDFPSRNLSENEQYIIDNDIAVYKIIENIHNMNYSILHKYVKSSNDLEDIAYGHDSVLDLYGVPQFENKTSKLFNCRNGLRVTTDQIKHHKRTIYYIGPSYAVGLGASDSGTIASNLQRLLNTFASEEEMIVHNYSCYYNRSAGSNKALLLKKIKSIPGVPGDIVIVHEREISASSEIPHIDISHLFQRPHNFGEVFIDKGHFTEDGNKAIAEEIYKHLKINKFYPKKTVSHYTTPISNNNLHLFEDNAKQLQNYKDILSEFYHSMFPRPKIGAIVMNCNPFTFGHRYLIENASKMVDHLIIFVVQEDKSFFPFEDRLALVDAGTADLHNVTVIPSGQFIISSLTFTEYFNKSEIQDRTIDSSIDVNLFGQEIAPCLDISVRFVGEEPFDAITRQYNETMKVVLPKYGVDVVEIPRMEQAGEVISASRVRKLLEERKFHDISMLVPDITLNYLIENYSE